MATQSIDYLGTSYDFPADARDEEILQFLSKAPHADSPISPPPLSRTPGAPSSQPMNKVNLIGGTSAQPDPATSRPPSLEKITGGAATGALNASSANVGHRLLQKFGPSKGTLSQVPYIGNLLQKAGVDKSGGDLYPGEATLPQIPNAAAMNMVGYLGGAESEPGEISAAGGGSLPPSEDTSAAPGSESANVGASATRSTPLLQKLPSAGARSNLRDAVGIAHGILRPSFSGIMDAATSIKSILAKHNAEPLAEAEVEAEAKGTTKLPTSADIAGQPLGQGRYGTNVDQWGTRIPDRTFPQSNRPTATWKSQETGGEVLPTVAPQTQGKLSQSDLSSMLERTGPPRGGKGQTGRAILRRNVKSMQPTETRAGSRAEDATGPFTPLEREARGEGEQTRAIGRPADLAIGAKPRLVKKGK